MDTPDEVVAKTIEQQVERIRKAIGYTPLRVVAEETGLHENTISNILSGRTRPSRRALAALTDRYFSR